MKTGRFVKSSCFLLSIVTTVASLPVVVNSVVKSGGNSNQTNTSGKYGGYKPVIIIHGVNDQPSTLEFMANYIAKAHPGTRVDLIHILHGVGSYLPMWYQVAKFREVVEKIVKNSTTGVNLIGYSQGGLVARGVLSTLDNHKVDTFISLCGPQNGVFGETDKSTIPLYPWIIKNLYRIFYTKLGQLINLGGYWKDPFQTESYRKNSEFLAMLNNETSNPNPRSEEFRENFIQIKRLVLIGGPNDTTITPWQSSFFGFYDETGKNVTPRQQQEVYVKDSFGLKTLDQLGSLYEVHVPGLDHQDFPNSVDFMNNHLLPWLN